MIEAAAIEGIVSQGAPAPIAEIGQASPANPELQSSAVGFEEILSRGLEEVNDKIASANDLVRQFAVDDSVPVHQVTIALEEARLSAELAMTVRERLVETYRELMNLQL